jgi:tRNA(Ile)-lysidine synthase
VLTRDADFDLTSAAFSSFDFSGGAVVAVSGGSDSTALLLFLKKHFDRFHPAAFLLAVTVDHALRAGSAAVAAAVAGFCAVRGIAHRTLVWTGSKPDTGLPQAAREARYRLLAQAASEAGIALVVTGHTADDQAETVLMRQARSADAGEPGLAGMAPATLHEGAIWIVRPLLGVRRAALRAWLGGQGVTWIDDPTNADMRFERPRVRAGREQSAAPVEETLALAQAAARRRVDLGRRAALLIRDHATCPVAGLVRLDPAFADVADREAARQALRILLAVIGGTTFLPPGDKTEAALAGLAAGRRRATLSRCVVDRRRPGVFLHRERRGLPVPCNAVPEMVWDGRRRITFHGGGSETVIEPAGPAVNGIVADVAPPGLIRAALSAEPSLTRRKEGSDVPQGDDFFRAEPVLAPWRSFLPSFDLAPARAAAALIGASAIPEPPFCGSIGLEP